MLEVNHLHRSTPIPNNARVLFGYFFGAPLLYHQSITDYKYTSLNTTLLVYVL